jgi:uncharacterized protein (TIGR02246 family)
MASRIDDLEAIRRLLAIYGQLLDSKRFTEWGELFTEDAVFRVWGATHRGRDEIVREIGGMQPEAPGKHIVLQPVIDLDPAAPDRAWAWTDLCALATGPDGVAIATIGRYHDRLVRNATDGRWRFEERVIVMAGEAVPADTHPGPAY